MTSKFTRFTRAWASTLYLLAAAPSGAITHNTVAWNTDGQMCVARLPAAVTNLAAVSAGGWFALGITGDGRVVAWGDDAYGQTDVPHDLAVPGSGVASVSAGGYHALALRGDGHIVAWGYDHQAQASVPEGLAQVVAVSAGGFHSLALRSDGTVVAWGDDSLGQCDVPGGLTGVVAIAAGNAHSLALKSDGTVVAWGSTNSGEGRVPAGLANVVAIAAGGHSMALRADGTVAAWGDTGHGESLVPAGLAQVVGIDAGAGVSIARRADGSLVAWGNATFVPASRGPFLDISVGTVVAVARTANPFARLSRLPAPLDFDGDTASDLALFDPRRSLWHVKLSSTGALLDGAPISWQGQPVPGDYDGDGRWDVASYDGAGNWSIRKSSDGQILGGGPIAFGWGGAVPVPQDYDGDGRTDLAVYDPGAGGWYVRQSSDGALMNGGAVIVGVDGGRGVPVPGDIDGDGRCDLAAWDRSTGSFYARSSLTGQDLGWPFVATPDVPVYAPFAADLHGMGEVDLGVYAWRTHIVRGYGSQLVPAGLFLVYPYEEIGPMGPSIGRFPVIADYDADGTADLATYKAGNRQWTVRPSGAGTVVAFAWPTDRQSRGLVPLDNQFRINRALHAGP